jgi:hypothetical protein
MRNVRRTADRAHQQFKVQYLDVFDRIGVALRVALSCGWSKYPQEFLRKVRQSGAVTCLPSIFCGGCSAQAACQNMTHPLMPGWQQCHMLMQVCLL